MALLNILRYPDARHIFHLYVVETRNPSHRDPLLNFLNERGIDAKCHYPIAIPDQRAMSDVPFEVPDGCENARRLCASEVSLPIHPYLNDAEVAEVKDAKGEPEMWALEATGRTGLQRIKSLRTMSNRAIPSKRDVII